LIVTEVVVKFKDENDFNCENSNRLYVKEGFAEFLFISIGIRGLIKGRFINE
jgi:hypothetical protein